MYIPFIHILPGHHLTGVKVIVYKSIKYAHISLAVRSHFISLSSLIFHFTVQFIQEELTETFIIYCFSFSIKKQWRC